MKKIMIFILGILMLFSFEKLTSQDNGNENWRSFVYDKQAWGLGPVNRLDSYGNRLFASGYFAQRFYDTVWFNGIAELQGTTWLPLGTGEYSGVRGSWITTINDMIVKDSSLYVVGCFDTAGAISAKNIAKWNINSRTWSSVGKGTNGIIVSIVKLNNKLFIGGRFDSLYTDNDTIIANNIAEWDGTNWNNLGNGLNGPVSDMNISGNMLYVVGEFDTVGNIYSRNIGIWNDSLNQWSGFGDYGPNGDVFAVCKHQDNLYLGGYFDSVNTNMGQVTAKNLVKWDGTTWSSFGNGIDGHIHRLKSFDTNLYVVGSFEKVKNDTTFCENILKWDGIDWQYFGYGTNENIRDLTFWGDSLLVGGEFSFAGDTLAEHIGLWYITPPPPPGKNTSTNTDNQIYSLMAYPNPTNAETIIEFICQSKEKIDISIYNMNGNKIETIANKEFGIGKHKIVWFTAGLNSGVYICKLKSNSFENSVKIIISK